MGKWKIRLDWLLRNGNDYLILKVYKKITLGILLYILLVFLLKLQRRKVNASEETDVLNVFVERLAKRMGLVLPRNPI